MTDLISSLKTLGSRLGKGFIIEAYLEWKGDDVIAYFKKILDDAGVTTVDLKDYVTNNRALPIPASAFMEMKGLEDYLETIEEERIFEILAKARPDLANELIKLGDLGAEYVVKFKKFIINSIKDVESPTEEEVKEATPDREPPIEGDEEDVNPPQRLQPFSGIRYAGDIEQKPVKEAQNEPPAQEAKTKKVICNNCGHTRLATVEEAERWSQEPCPECGE